MNGTTTPEGGRQTETELARLLEAAPELLVRIRLDGVVEYASPAAVEIVGRAPEELVGTQALDLVDFADRDAAREKLARLAAAEPGAEDRITARVRHRDGRLVWIDVHGRRVGGREGEPAIVAVARLSGDEVEAQRALARVEERFRELVEWLPAIVYEAEPGPDGRFLYVSPQIEEILGFTPQEWIADRHLWLDRIHPDEREAAIADEREQEQRALETDRRIASEYRMRHRNGRIVWIRDVARLCRAEGSTPFWRGVLIDITAEHSAQLALAGAQERHRRMVEGLPACAYRAEPRAMGRWLYVAPEIENLLGYSPDEWRADPTLWRASLHADDRESVERLEAEHAGNGPGTEFVTEYRLRHRSGRVVWVRDRAMISQDTDGDPVIDGFLTDISAERAAAAGAELVADVLRLTCADCGAVWGADRLERCHSCRSENVDAVSLNAVLRDLAASRRQVEGLLDGIQKHLDALGSNLRSVSAQLTEGEARD